jgi:fumarate reductase subunit D
VKKFHFAMNTTDSNVSDEPQPWENIVAAAVMGILSIPSLILYLLIVFVIVRNPKLFGNNSYYTLLLSLAFSDIITLLLFVFYSIPCTLLQERMLGDSFDAALGVVCNTTYFAGMACIASIALNRYWAVCRFHSYDRIFAGHNAKKMVAFVWGLGIFSGSWEAFPCCNLRFWYDSYSWSYDMSLWGNQYFVWYDRSYTLTMVSTLIVCYITIFAKLPKTTGSYATRLRDDFSKHRASP